MIIEIYLCTIQMMPRPLAQNSVCCMSFNSQFATISLTHMQSWTGIKAHCKALHTYLL